MENKNNEIELEVDLIGADVEGQELELEQSGFMTMLSYGQEIWPEFKLKYLPGIKAHCEINKKIRLEKGYMSSPCRFCPLWCGWAEPRPFCIKDRLVDGFKNFKEPSISR